MTAVASEIMEELLVERHDAACHVVLDRSRALNALSIAMKERLANELPKLAKDAETYAVILKSANQGAFCAGGDVKELISLADNDLKAAQQCLADEYRLNWLLECFFKPTVALINGAVMGSGVGLVQYGTHIVAAEDYRFAMPETAIGFFPDVGMAHRLARLPHSVGVYLALTGRTIGRADAYSLGLVTHCIDAVSFSAIEDELADAQPIDPVLDARHEVPGEGDLNPYLSTIASVFGKPNLEDIIAALADTSTTRSEVAREWCGQVAGELRQKSPLALKISLKHVRRAAQQDLRQTLIADYHLACRFLEAADFREGVRALLVDKTKDPRWQHGAVDEVTDADVQTYFEHGDEAEFLLPTKEQTEFK
ncbi:MAG: enoyl-CoA hydratase/isomerase family protein [Pseudomonadota bacterium]